MVAVCVDAAESVEMKEIAKLNSAGFGAHLEFKARAWAGFVGLVSNEAKYDVKVAIKDNLGENIQLGDKWYEYSTVGNILYGFYGLAAGFGKTELHAGAGAAQIIDIFAKGDMPGGPNTLFDTDDDYFAVEFGFYLFENYYDDGILTENEFLEALAKYPHADMLALVPKPPDKRLTPRKHPVDKFYQPQ